MDSSAKMNVSPDRPAHDAPEEQLRARLEELEKRLREMPSHKLMERRLVQLQVDNLKNKIRVQEQRENEAHQLCAAKKHAGLELIDARILLAETPASAPALRQMRQLRVEELERIAHVQSVKKPIKQERNDGPRATGVRNAANEIPGIPKPTRSDPRSEGLRIGMSGGAGLTGDSKIDSRESVTGAGSQPVSRIVDGKGTATEDSDNAPALKLDSAEGPGPSAEIIEEELGAVREGVKNADQKAMFILAALIAILAFLVTHNVAAGWFKGLGQWSIADAVGLAATLGLTVAASMMLAVLYPSLRDPGRSLRFLDAITKPGEPETLGNGLRSRPADYHIAAIQEEFYELTKVCIVKYRNLRYGFWVGVVAAFISLLFLILSKKPHPIYHRNYY